MNKWLKSGGRSIALGFAIAIALAACGGGNVETLPSPSAGQVAPATTAAKVSFYAASRFAEQVSFGPTPALVAELQAKGFEKWIDEQMALPLVPLDTRIAEEVYAYGSNDVAPNRITLQVDIGMVNASLRAPDQLRWRVTWSLSLFMVAATTKGEVPGWAHWTNLLYRQSFGRYGDLLREASLNPHMAHYLDNDQNRPKSAECPFCAPNENYARELMQLFSIGVFKLNPDGTPQRDARGRYIETYVQKDVEELARALTGWQHDPEPPNRPHRNWGNWGKPMVASSWPPERDAGRKVVMGRTFAAGQSQAKDLGDTVDMLMSHQNIAPFVALRLIQHLVKSDPSPAYIARIGAVFRNNGAGVAGDMKALVKAILLDPEARRGDTVAAVQAGDGKIREPWLHRLGTLRGMGCREPMLRPDGGYSVYWTQPFSRPDSVFGYYAPTDRAPGSNLLAPEQRLLNSNEFTVRFGELNFLRWNNVSQQNSIAAFTAAGCDAEAFVRAYGESPKAYMNLLSLRYFRGAMPPTLRTTLEQLIRNPQWNTSDPTEGPIRLLDYALATPYYGVLK